LQLTFDVGVIAIFGHRLAGHVKEELRRNYFTMEKGYNSFPIPVACTSYSQAIKVLRPRISVLCCSPHRHNVINTAPPCRRGSGWARC
jgi:hypothetical protein